MWVHRVTGCAEFLDERSPNGLFIGEVVNFVLVALAVFLFIVKFLGWILRVKKEEAAAAAPPLTKDQELLAEIRDLLKGERPVGA